jgi:hypothetical protein
VVVQRGRLDLDQGPALGHVGLVDLPDLEGREWVLLRGGDGASGKHGLKVIGQEGVTAVTE